MTKIEPEEDRIDMESIKDSALGEILFWLIWPIGSVILGAFFGFFGRSLGWW